MCNSCTMAALTTQFRKLLLLSILRCFTLVKEPWHMLPNNTGDYCPARDICIWEHQQEPEYIPARGSSCCTDCSCQHNCGDEGTCCFPDLDIKNASSRKYKACLQTLLPEIELVAAHRVVHYLMVDSNPDHGCHVDVPELSNGEQCGNVSVAWWGTKHPVFSKLKKTIYKNKYCALCHNATDTIQMPISLHNCRSTDVIDALLSNRSILEKISFLNLKCYATFDFSDVEVKYHECYFNVVGTCKSDFKLPGDFGLTQNNIVQACESGLFSPFVDRSAIYLNVFCAICNGDFSSTHALCPLLSARTESKTWSKFYTLLDIDVTNALMDAPVTKHVPIYRAVCLTKTNQVECRRIFCRKDMVFTEGDCNYLSRQMFGYTFLVTLKLIPDHGVNIQKDRLLDELRENILQVSKSSSWSNSWKIFAVFVKDNTYGSNSILAEELLVSMIYRPKSISPFKLFDEIRSNLIPTRFNLSVGQTTYSLNQVMSDYELLSSFYMPTPTGASEDRYSMHGVKAITNQTVLDKIYKDHVYTLNHVIRTIERPLFNEITKIFFCDLVQLEKDEYIMYGDKVIMYYKLLYKYFIKGQFDVGIDQNGEIVIKICLSESGFLVTNSAPPTSILDTDLIVLCFVLASSVKVKSLSILIRFLLSQIIFIHEYYTHKVEN